MDPFTFTASSRPVADQLCQQVADDWIGTFHDDQYHRLTFRGRAAYRALVAEHFQQDGLLENGLRSAWESALDVLQTPQEFGLLADEQDRVESVMTR
jgi:hypothetical protein